VSKSCVLLYWQRYYTALEQWASAKLCGVAQGMELRNFRRGHHLYSTGRPSRWASAHVLVYFYLAPFLRYYHFFSACNLLHLILSCPSVHTSDKTMPMYDSLFASTYMLVLFMCCYFRNVGSEKHEEVEITFTSTRRS